MDLGELVVSLGEKQRKNAEIATAVDQILEFTNFYADKIEVRHVKLAVGELLKATPKQHAALNKLIKAEILRRGGMKNRANEHMYFRGVRLKSSFQMPPRCYACGEKYVKSAH